MTDTLKNLFAPIFLIISSLILLIPSSIRDALFGVIFDLIDGILEKFGITGMGNCLYSIICMVPPFIEIIIVLALVIFVAGLFSFILDLIPR